MQSPTEGATRLARAGGLAGSAFALASGAHLAGGGGMPSGVWSASILLLAFAASVLVTGRRLGRVTVIGLLGGSQLTLHQALELTQTASASCLAGLPDHAAHLMAGPASVCASSATAGAPMNHSTGGGAAMLVAHALAAVLLGLLLARGEAAVWFLASLVTPVWRVAVRLSVAPATSNAQPMADGAQRSEPVLGGVGRRGPPWLGAVTG